MRQMKTAMRSSTIFLGPVLAMLLLLSLSGCGRTLTGSKLTSANYDQVTLGMSKAQVEKILGPPTTAETKEMLVFKKTTYRYEDGKKFAIVTFKNDEVDSKDTNLGRTP
jgi:outer membrane protein assembly factor BamE (lipoprotein component of BamABCDE complex)